MIYKSFETSRERAENGIFNTIACWENCDCHFVISENSLVMTVCEFFETGEEIVTL